MNPIHQVLQLRSYRAHLVPHHVNLQDVEDLADAKLLPTIRLKAASATHAEALARLTSGQRVLRVERVELVEG